MMRRACVWAVLGLGLLFAGPAQAQKKAPKPTRAALLPISVKDLPPEVAKKLGATVLEELGALRVFEVIPGKTLSASLEPLRKKKIYAKGCEEKKACMQAVGKAVKAGVLLHLQVARAQEGVTLTMRLFDVRSAREVRKGTEFGTEDPADLERAARWITRKVSSPIVSTIMPGKAKIQIDCEEGGADLYVNGKSFGKKTGTSLKVSSGVFDLLVKKEGFEPFHEVVAVYPGDELRLQAALKPAGSTRPAIAAAEPIAPVEPPPPLKPVEGKPEEKKELPAWAVFDTPKPAGTAPATQPPKSGAAPWAGATAKKETKPFLPEPAQEKPREEPVRREKRFYQTWWFWTLVGAAVAGGVGTGTYFLLQGGGGGGAGTGSAAVSWQ